MSFSYNFLKDCIYLFIFGERGREGERGGEKHQWVVASHMPPAATQACALTGNQTSTLWFTDPHIFK